MTPPVGIPRYRYKVTWSQEVDPVLVAAILYSSHNDKIADLKQKSITGGLNGG